ncbi:DUF2920 family protein [Citrobacter freundii]|nr:DUF2920 family protein [Citrobacter freundii]
MIQNIKRTFISNCDTELSPLIETRTCSYHICNPKKDNLLVVYIPGFGGDLGNYSKGLCEKIADKYNLTTMTVEYFCYHSRPNVGGKISFSALDIMHINNIARQFSIDESTPLATKLSLINEASKACNKTSKIFAMIEPKNNEYQNFGLLPALDIINAINDVRSNFDMGNSKIILIGSSYGGYIANMVEKIAPGMVDAIIDNSSWSAPNMKYIIGRELDNTELHQRLDSHVIMGLYVKSPWTLTNNLPNTLSKSRIKMRSFDSEQISQMIHQGGGDCLYVFYHYLNDKIAPAKEKLEMILSIQKSNKNKIICNILKNKKDIDGVLVKTLEHGLGMSIFELFKKHFPEISKEITNKPKRNIKNKVTQYQCDDLVYSFDNSTHPMTVTIKKVN